MWQSQLIFMYTSADALIGALEEASCEVFANGNSMQAYILKSDSERIYQIWFALWHFLDLTIRSVNTDLYVVLGLAAKFCEYSLFKYYNLVDLSLL